MSNVTVCVRFRPLTTKEISDHGHELCIKRLDHNSFICKDEKDEEIAFNFDKVFYSESEQASVYEFIALPIVRDAVNAINGTMITYGQTGAGKTYSMEGPNIIGCDDMGKGLLQRVVGGLFESIKFSEESVNYSIKLSMVEIYMEKVRDLFDLSKDNIQIKETKAQGIILSGVTEITVVDELDTVKKLYNGIANRAVSETQMNIASSRSHSIYIFTVIQELKADKRVRSGKLVLVDLAGSEKVEKTGAEGKVLEEAKTINKSLSSLGNVVHALTGPQGKSVHIPYRDSKLTRILQDALGGNSRAAILCCCSPSIGNALESLSTLWFGARVKYIKASPSVNNFYEGCVQKQGFVSSSKHELCERILQKLREELEDEHVKLLKELFILEGIIFDPDCNEELEDAYEDLTSSTIYSLQKAVEKLVTTNDKLKKEIEVLTARVAESKKLADEPGEMQNFAGAIVEGLRIFSNRVVPFFQK